MKRDEHKAFVRCSLFNILRDGIYSINALGRGIETFAVHEYLLQSIFLRMTGAQEQKLKCIRWEIATEDLDYRYKYFYKGSHTNECSKLDHKNEVYKDLLDSIKNIYNNYKLFNNEDAKEDFGKDICKKVENIFENSNIVISQKQKYDSFKALCNNMKFDDIADEKSIFKKDKDLFKIYNLLYKERNRCAHNTTSYQLNLPTLSRLRDEEFQRNDNIFMFYAVLLLIDEIFIRLFDKYENLEHIM